jgi:Lon protease-like protein
METCRLLANSQAVLLANLAHGLTCALGADPEEVAAAMEALDMHHQDERVEVLAAGMRRAMLATLRAKPGRSDLN